MSRLRFGTYNDTVTTISASGFSGFPNPYGTGDITYRIQVPLQQIGSWWWRIKNWSLSSTCSFVDEDFTPFSFTSGPLTPNVSNAADELELKDPGRNHEFEPIVTFLPGLTILDVGSGLFYPDISINLLMGDPSGGHSIVEIWDYDIFLPADGTFTAMIDGLAKTLYYRVSPSGGGLYGTFTPGDFILTPLEYWTYDGIYDASTGDVVAGMSVFDL